MQLATAGLTTEWINADPKLRAYIESQAALNQWLIDNRDAIDDAKRALLDYGDVRRPDAPEGPTVAGRAGYEIYLDTRQLDQDIVDMNTEFDGMGGAINADVNFRMTGLTADEIAEINSDADGIANSFNANITSNADEAKTPIEALNDQLDIFNTADGVGVWAATMDSNADTIKREKLDPLQAFLDSVVEGNPYPVELKSNTDAEDRKLQSYWTKLKSIEDKTVTLTTVYDTVGTPPAGGGSDPYTGPNRAVGGHVIGGQVYTVGERGPEQFIPNQSGEIIPNNQRGGSGVNIYIQGGDSQQVMAAVNRALEMAGLKSNNTRRTL